MSGDHVRRTGNKPAADTAQAATSKSEREDLRRLANGTTENVYEFKPRKAATLVHSPGEPMPNDRMSL